MDMHELGMNRPITVHGVAMIMDIKRMGYEQKFLNSMGVSRENLLCLGHELGKNMPQNHELFYGPIMLRVSYMWVQLRTGVGLRQTIQPY